MAIVFIYIKYKHAGAYETQQVWKSKQAWYVYAVIVPMQP